MDLTTATTVQLLRALDRGQVSSSEILEAQIANYERLNPTVNAVIAADFEQARAEASAADDLYAAGDPRGDLHGLPMTIKDCYETVGLPTVAGAPEYVGHEPSRDATVVRLLRRAGAIIWGKTNVPYLAGDHQTYNAVHGLTRNPWDLERTAGGSSGGAAVAIATGMTTAEVGSDIGGSIRQPASHNGVFGLKTTFGLVSGRGHIPGAPGSVATMDLGVFGPMGRSCGDLRSILEVLTDTSTAANGVPGLVLPHQDEPVDIEDLRIGVWANDRLAPVDASVLAVIDRAMIELEESGAKIDPDARPPFVAEQLWDTYQDLLTATMAGGWSDDLYAKLVRRAVDDPTDVAARRATLSHRDWMEADECRAQAQVAWAELFEHHIDVLVAPVSPVPAFVHDTERSYDQRSLSVNGVELPYRNQLFWAGLATMPGLPAITIPLGLSDDGLPIGVQLIGPQWSDHRLIAIGEEICSVLGAEFRPPPLALG